jgi:hypothetical protein
MSLGSLNHAEVTRSGKHEGIPEIKKSPRKSERWERHNKKDGEREFITGLMFRQVMFDSLAGK